MFLYGEAGFSRGWLSLNCWTFVRPVGALASLSLADYSRACLWIRSGERDAGAPIGCPGRSLAITVLMSRRGILNYPEFHI